MLRALMALVPNTYERADWIEIGHGLKALCADDAEGFYGVRRMVGDTCTATTRRRPARRGTASGRAGCCRRVGGSRGLPKASTRHDTLRSYSTTGRRAASGPPGPLGGYHGNPLQVGGSGQDPPRDWLYGDILLRKFISMTVAPGGVGKSSLVAVETLAQVTGKRAAGRGAVGRVAGVAVELGGPVRGDPEEAAGGSEALRGFGSGDWGSAVRG